jgi:hypothetical protein
MEDMIGVPLYFTNEPIPHKPDKSHYCNPHATVDVADIGIEGIDPFLEDGDFAAQIVGGGLGGFRQIAHLPDVFADPRLHLDQVGLEVEIG